MVMLILNDQIKPFNLFLIAEWKIPVLSACRDFSIEQIYKYEHTYSMLSTLLIKYILLLITTGEHI